MTAPEVVGARVALDRAVGLHQAGRFKEAVPWYVYAVRTDIAEADATNRPPDPDILHAAGVALAMGGRRKEAVEFLEGALRYGKAQSGAVWSALGLAYVELRELGKAERCYRLACKFDDRSAASWTGYANLAAAGGALELAERRYDRALSCPPRDAEELIAQGMTYLRRGHWRKGWRAYEARSQTAMWADRNPHAATLRVQTAVAAERTAAWRVAYPEADLVDAPVEYPQFTYWRRPAATDHVLVMSEQGLGDTVQFARYVPTLVSAFGCRVTLLVNPGLVEMIARALPNVPVLPYTAEPDGTTGWALLLSLPAILREAESSDVPPPILPFGLGWAPHGDRGPPERVFVHGRGNAQHGYDFDRSAPGMVLEHAVRDAGYEVVTADYQNIAAAGEVQVMAEPTWRDTVERLLSCDRCLTVDTGLAHVAGSLGIPTDLCVPTIPEWRWGQPGATKTPWYPRARVWRRRRTEEWGPMVAEILSTWRGA